MKEFWKTAWMNYLRETSQHVWRRIKDSYLIMLILWQVYMLQVFLVDPAMLATMHEKAAAGSASGEWFAWTTGILMGLAIVSIPLALGISLAEGVLVGLLYSAKPAAKPKTETPAL